MLNTKVVISGTHRKFQIFKKKIVNMNKLLILKYIFLFFDIKIFCGYYEHYENGYVFYITFYVGRK